MRRVQFVLRLTCFLFLMALIAWALIHRADFDRPALQAWLQGLGPWAGPVFVLVYAAATVLFVPGSLLSLAGGALFGPVWGTVYNLTGATVGATAAFLLARYLLGGWVERRSGGRLKRLADEVEAQGWRFAAFVRLVPLFPFNFLNYALGLTRIGLLSYVLTSLVCMVPGAIA